MTQDVRAPARPAGPGFDKRKFRAALGAFVTGVTIVTTADQAGQPAGLTANSFNSVSLDPPLVLWSLALDSSNLQAFRQAGWWAVHVLAAGQEALSDRFAQPEQDKFEDLPTTAGPGGIPLLDRFAARFICRAAFEYEGGDHAIFLGAVESFEQTGLTPLVYHQGRYGAVLPHAEALDGVRARSALAALEEQGIVAGRNGNLHLTPSGQDVAVGLAALAQERGLAGHEVSALRHLLGRLS